VRPLGREFFARSVHEVAPELIGCTLLVDGVGGRIVEVEAYDRSDPASHSYRGLTARTRSMFGPPGHAYVYRSYGVHWCANLVCAGASAALVRALEPTHGHAEMATRRGTSEDRLLCAGPGRVCQALGLTGEHDGLPLDAPPFALQGGAGRVEVVRGPRVGITRAVELPWRYCERGSRYLSRPVPEPTRERRPAVKRRPRA
jgi:DNA-3-methyladenine glycosylase